MIKYFLILVLFLSCAPTKEYDIQDDIASVINDLGKNEKKEMPTMPLDFVGEEVLPINNLTIKNHLLSIKNSYPEFDIDGYFNIDKKESLNIEKNLNRTFFSVKKLDDIFSRTTKNNFWKTYEEEIGNSGFTILYLPIYNKDKTEFILYFEQGNFNLDVTQRLCLFKRKGNEVEMKKLILISL